MADPRSPHESGVEIGGAHLADVDAWLREKVVPIALSIQQNPSQLLSSEQVKELLDSHRRAREARRLGR